VIRKTLKQRNRATLTLITQRIDVKMAFQSVDWEALLREDSELPADVFFKVYDNGSVLARAQDNDSYDSDEMDMEAKIFKAHKFLLAAVSPMFRKQFFGSLPPPQVSQPVTVEETSSKGFGIMLDFLYQKADKFVFACDHFACLFEVKNLGEKYQISDLVHKTHLEISSRQISSENLLEATRASKNFSHLFTEISQELMKRCNIFFTKNYKSLEKVRKLLRDHEDSDADSEAIMLLIKSESVNCDGCKRSAGKCLDGKSVTALNAKVGAKVVRDTKSETSHKRESESQGVGVLVRSDGGYHWDVLWENGLQNSGWIICDGGYFLFRCL